MSSHPLASAAPVRVTETTCRLEVLTVFQTPSTVISDSLISWRQSGWLDSCGWRRVPSEQSMEFHESTPWSAPSWWEQTFPDPNITHPKAHPKVQGPSLINQQILYPTEITQMIAHHYAWLTCKRRHQTSPSLRWSKSAFFSLGRQCPLDMTSPQKDFKPWRMFSQPLGVVRESSPAERIRKKELWLYR